MENHTLIHMMPRSLLTALLVALVGLAAAGSTGLAQDGAAPAADAAPVTYPAFVAAGECATLDPTLRFALADVAIATDSMAATRSPAEPDSSAAEPDLLDVAFAELFAEPHAIVVIDRAEDRETAIACGDLAGPAASGDLAVGLAEQNGSGYAGLARLHAAEDKTALTLFLTEGLAGTASDTAISVDDLPPCCQTGPTSGAAIVHVVNFAFLLPPIVEMAVGATVTWVNQGPSDHAVTVFRDGELVADVATLAPEQSFAYTFEEPGSYDYLCTRHPGMQARIDVVSLEEGVTA